MTGLPAETWRKFRYQTAPAWAYAFLLLLCTGVGLLIVFLAMYLVSRRASGHLPLTRASSRKVALGAWIPAGLFLFTLVLWVVAIVISSSSSDETTGSLAALVLLFSFIVLIAALVGWLIVKPDRSTRKSHGAAAWRIRLPGRDPQRAPGVRDRRDACARGSGGSTGSAFANATAARHDLN